jgi:hypothetical protein
MAEYAEASVVLFPAVDLFGASIPWVIGNLLQLRNRLAFLSI